MRLTAHNWDEGIARVGRDDSQCSTVAGTRHRCARSSASQHGIPRLRHSRRFSHRGQGYAGFGQTVVQTGPAAAINPFRFSTKYLDRDTGLYYYGYRYYDPMLGGWVRSCSYA